AHLLWQCELAGFTPLVAFTSDDVLVAQALAAAGLGVALLPDLALRAARHPGVRTEPLPGARRQGHALTYGGPPRPPPGRRLTALALRAARPPGVRPEPLPGARRQVHALTYGEPPGPPAVERLLDTLADAAAAPPAAATRKQPP